VGEVAAPGEGFVRRLGAIAVGHAALHLGAGRRTKEDAIDYAVGIVCRRKRGEPVEPGEVLAEVHAADDAAAEAAAAEVLAAFELGDEPPAERPIVLDTIA
jgi:thymidine phosphorylase